MTVGAALRATPEGRRVARIGPRTQFGGPRVVSVVGRRPGWLRIARARAPERAAAWIAGGDGEAGTDVSVHIDRSARRLIVRDGDASAAVPVAVGAPRTPRRRPLRGHRQARDGRAGHDLRLLRSRALRPPARPAVGLAGPRPARRPRHQRRPIGHAASIGCLRACDRDLRRLMRSVPLGAPVFIRASAGPVPERRRDARGRRRPCRRARRPGPGPPPAPQGRRAGLHGHAYRPVPDARPRRGDAHIIRNAGGLATDDAIRSLSASQRLLGTEEIVVVMHEGCGLQGASEDDYRQALAADGVLPTWRLGAFDAIEPTLRNSLERLRSSPELAHATTSGGSSSTPRRARCARSAEPLSRAACPDARAACRRGRGRGSRRDCIDARHRGDASTTAITISELPVEISGTASFCRCPVQHELDADERQDQRQAGREVDEPVEQPGHQEEQRAQAEQRERVGREDDVRLLGHPEHRRDRVQREQDVGARRSRRARGTAA